MRNCYNKFIEFYPWKKSEFPTYEIWIVSDEECARTFRQGWAASKETLLMGDNSPEVTKLQYCTVRLAGGSSLRMPGGRGPDCAFDQLLALLERCEVLVDYWPTGGKWEPGGKALMEADFKS